MHKETKTTQQQIHSHLKKVHVHVSRLLVVLNEAIEDINSGAVNKHTKSFHQLNKRVNERTS